VKPRSAWHWLLNTVAWLVLLFFLAIIIGSALVEIFTALK
jgi:hypothetical protein